MVRQTFRLFLLLILIASLLSLSGEAGHGWENAFASAHPRPALVYVPLPEHAGLVRFTGTGLPVYARLYGRSGDYVLAAANPAGLRSLAIAGLSYQILETDPQAGSYYLVSFFPGRSRPDWSFYGRLLLDDGYHALLQADRHKVDQLVRIGAELQPFQLEPQPYATALEPGAISAVIFPDPFVQQMVAQVESQIVYQYTGDLSGEWPVDIAGETYTLDTRYTYSGVPIQQATRFTGQHLAGLGLAVEYQQWDDPTNPNVIAELTGQTRRDEIFMITAHLDNLPSASIAPGADDNASGSVAVLIAADILSQFQWDCSLRFALWTGEEQGLLGSRAYAKRAYNAGENIAGVLNLDMIAWNTTGSSPDIDLHARSSLPGSLSLAQLFADVVNAYELDLVPEIVPNGTSASDHGSFWEYGYPAILGIEDYYPGGRDFNPYYHTRNDRLEFLNLPYFTEFVKASVAAFAQMSGCLDVSAMAGYLQGQVTAGDSGRVLPGSSVTVQDSSGSIFGAFVGPDGDYTLALPAGAYTVTAQAGFYLSQTEQQVSVQTGLITSLNFSLEPARRWHLFLPLFR